VKRGAFMDDSLSGLFSSNSQMMTLVICIIAVVLIISVLRSLFRMVLPVVIVGLVLVVFLGYTPEDVINKGKQFASNGSTYILNGILPFFNSDNGNGSSEINPESKSFLEEDFKGFLEEEGENEQEMFEEHESEIDVNKM
jgi:hypothetical protein